LKSFTQPHLTACAFLRGQDFLSLYQDVVKQLVLSQTGSGGASASVSQSSAIPAAGIAADGSDNSSDSNDNG